jgi:hypothetical protein
MPARRELPMMDEEQFWKIIERSRRWAKKHKPRNGDEFLERQMEELPKLLRKLKPEELLLFQRRFEHCTELAYRYDLWGAAYWMCGGCSDDGFIDFRSTLVSLGKKLFDQVLADPDSLADLIDRPDVPYLQVEGFQYLAGRVYQELTGTESWPDDNVPYRPRKPKGRHFDYENDRSMKRRFPKLVARFPEMGD